ncbi:EAL domain-containing protein [Mesorhizobium sp. M1E.F.Ca.ET.041.01.1.1]|uniref:bifunctional diguanylate cyclase/phosphodiesterase n=1 Tax=Mesorhizobium sp. M1E.F.Ca.ET.041.01.1.1 TaxID=2496759 RepID=UPI000FC9A5D5|nr:EAL domain-containing protein [Mesorhizobium sp. M1E.F.Ca.ET.041.01.1.1]RUW34370.1 GGDEF and EAL domain-containing protein [Mesorhizobium sp. M1E.F.Ca.ET.041.01.1.1]
MLKVYTCIATQHDLRLVALAAFICALASFTAVNLLHHVGRSESEMRRVWLAVAAIATGFGIWATHFIAMLAFQPAVSSGYNIGLTIVSLLAAIALTGTGLTIGISPRIPHGRWIGGAVVGGGIAVMHYTGMAAFEIEGRVVWDVPLVAASIILGGLFGATALPVALHSNTVKWKALGAVVLTVAICSHHFTAMAAAAIMPDPRIVISATALPGDWMATGVALVSIVIILLAIIGLALDVRDLRRAGEAARMQELADAAVEGLIVCNETDIVAANRSFAALACVDGTQPAGRPLASFFPTVSQGELTGTLQTPLEVGLCATDGSTVPVELIRHSMLYAGKQHRVLAVRDIRGRKRAEEEIQFLAHHDPLTKLPNRTSFNEKLEAEFTTHCSAERCLAVLFLDLDRFKEINDLFGHLVGDAVLQCVAEKISGVLKPGQMVARLGGDEFAVIVPGLPSAAYATRTAEAILDAFNDTGANLPAGVTIGTSIGIAVFPNDAPDRETLLSHADAALYEAKMQGRGVYCVFEPSMGEHLRDRRQFEHDVRHAISRKQLRLVYQPQAELLSNEIFGFEALLRWDHPERGAVPPAVFIPIAEECGAILKIGEWVLRTACAEAASWQQPLAISVNVSAMQLHGGNLPELVGAILKETGLDPSRLELEITETCLIKDMGRALAALRQLKSLGVQIAMDDFGTGYSSLSNLRAFPFDKIKVDQSLIRAVDISDEAAAVMRAVFGLARGLKLPVLAEGVETDAELTFLRQEACDAIQGYLLGRPCPISDFAQHTSRKGGTPASRRLGNQELRLVKNSAA